MTNYILKPCPFCGGKAVLNGGMEITPILDENGAYIDADFKEYPFYVECSICGSIGQAFDNNDDNDEADAVEAWNRRAKND